MTDSTPQNLTDYHAWNERLEALNRRERALGERLDRLYLARQQAAWKAAKGRRRFDPAKATAAELSRLVALREHLQKWAARWFRLVAARRQKIVAQLAQLAETLAIPVDETGLIYCRFSGLDYYTQGYGCNRYARASASLELLRLQALGGRACLLTQNDPRPAYPGPHHVATQTYYVLAYTTELGADLCRRHPGGLSKRATIKALLQLGANPRVFFPFLSYGYEERLGLDAWGNDLAAAA